MWPHGLLSDSESQGERRHTTAKRYINTRVFIYADILLEHYSFGYTKKGDCNNSSVVYELLYVPRCGYHYAGKLHTMGVHPRRMS